MTSQSTSTGKNRDKSLQAYYTKSSPIINTMIENLCLQDDQLVLEPCGGDGAFIDALIAQSKNLRIDVFELDQRAIDTLRRKYGCRKNITIHQLDFLTDENVQLMALSGGKYDRIIANPPYGAWQDPNKRKLLKKLFPNLYVKESYALFLFRCIQLLKVGGRLTFIIPDSFLNLHRHTELRRRLFRYCHIQRIQLFPSRFFPHVSFGYAGLCIITLEKPANPQLPARHEFVVETNYPNVEALLDGQDAKRYRFEQSKVYQQQDSALFVTDKSNVMMLLNSSSCRIGDIADCVTGFYSGNDLRFLRSASSLNKNGKKYKTIDTTQKFMGSQAPLNGLNGERCFVPIIKGGNTRYYKQNSWFMDWSIDAVRHYHTSKKSRFQNSEFYFRDGIGVPMVSAKAMTASMLDCRLFDQSIVGIFPQNPTHKYYLLALLNSQVANTLIRTINPTTNNSANYIKKIPFILPAARILTHIDRLVKGLLASARLGQPLNQRSVEEIDEMISQLYSV